MYKKRSFRFRISSFFMQCTNLTATNDRKNLFPSSNKRFLLLIFQKAAVFSSLSFLCLMINNPNNKFYKHQVEFCVILYDMSQLLEKHTIPTLTHLFPMHPFSIVWKYYGFLMFSGGRKKVHWEQVGYNIWNNL